MDINNYQELLDKGYENIPDNVKKLSRFEIPKVQIRIEAKNTYITNFNKIINTLNRERKHFIVEFLKKVGTMGEMRGQHLFLKGVYKEQVLNRLIELYSKTFVLCKICNKPDTEIQREGKKKFLKCTACGSQRAFLLVI
jgi:translation initiation factor 2 subunit 2